MSYAEKFFAAYVKCALWAETDGETDQSFIDRGFTIENLSPEATDKMRQDCKRFCESSQGAACLNASGLTPEQAGQDFWLTRNHHGAGFWDRDLAYTGEELTRLAHDASICTLYVGDDDMIHIA